MLAASREEELTARVETLTESRAGLVDAVDAERRRIERDLHDGAQQRLVAVAMTLGRAGQQFDVDPENARRLVEEAHGETKAALVDLRNLARGIHPAVLTDRGLDAALSALAERSPLPVDVSVLVNPQAEPHGRGGRLLRRQRGPDQRRQARARGAGPGQRAADRGPADRRHRRRRASAVPISNRAPACPDCATGCVRSTAP